MENPKPLPVILAIWVWACWRWNKWVGTGLALGTLLGSIASAVSHQKYLDSVRSKSLGYPMSSSGHWADYWIVWSPPGGLGLANCFVVSESQALWGNWLVLLVRDSGKLRRATVSSIAHQIPATSTLMVIFAYQARNWDRNTPLIEVICRDGLFLRSSR